MGLVLAMGLKAMGIADSIVNLAFGLTLGAVAVAFALSFGLGGQEAAARYLRRLQDKIDKERDEAKVKSALTPNQSTQDKVADAVRDNTPTNTNMPSINTASVNTSNTDIVDTTTLSNKPIDVSDIDNRNNNSDPTLLEGSGLIDNKNK